MNTSADEFAHGGGGAPPCVGLTSDALPKVQSLSEEKNSHTGVSTRNAPVRILPAFIQTIIISHINVLPTNMPITVANVGNEIQKHDVFCPNPKCSFMDYP